MNGLMVKDKAPVEALSKEQIVAIIERMKVAIPDGPRMSPAQLTAIAQESILYRTMPGRDVHYFLDKDNQLKRVDDYKRLVAWAISRERYLTGDQSATFEAVYQELGNEDKAREGVKAEDFAAYCAITTSKERKEFAAEVRQWIEMGFKPQEALAVVRQNLGEIGTRAIGVVSSKDWNIPTGWSKMQKAKKLALKNAINKKWGSPSVDELQMMTKSLARIDTIEADWDNVPIDQPAEVQARQAELEATFRQVVESGQGLTPADRKERLSSNVAILRGEDDTPIGENAPMFKNLDDLLFDVCETASVTEQQARDALSSLEIEFSPAASADIYEALVNEVS